MKQKNSISFCKASPEKGWAAKPLGGFALHNYTPLSLRDISPFRGDFFSCTASHLRHLKQMLYRCNYFCINGYFSSHSIAEPFFQNTTPHLDILPFFW